MKSTSKRTFYPGDEWLYFKLYTGIKKADDILIRSVFPVVKKMMREEIITKFFFLRYSDPDFHIRFRMLVKNPKDLGYILYTVNQKLQRACKNAQIYRIQVDTYNRELERYGKDHIEFSESIFSADSECVLSILKILCKKDENYRWMVALKMIDCLFNDFGLSLTEKASYIEKMSLGFKQEYGFDIHNIKLLNKIYRQQKPNVNLILNNLQKAPEEIRRSYPFLQKRSHKLKELIEVEQAVPLNNLSSYIHMMMNRLFPSKNRIYELVIYDFLFEYYRSELARERHQKH